MSSTGENEYGRKSKQHGKIFSKEIETLRKQKRISEAKILNERNKIPT